MVRVLVVGAGLGTNAGLGLEVPLAHGKLVTDGLGGFREISAKAVEHDEIMLTTFERPRNEL